MPCIARSIFLAALLASSLIGCGGRVSDTCDSCGGATELPGPVPAKLELSSADAAALMRAKVPPSAKLIYLDSDPQVARDGTSSSWISTFEDEDTQQAWLGRISTLSGVATVSLEPKSYVDCPGPGATDLSSRELGPPA